jgi:hypothetical protein
LPAKKVQQVHVSIGAASHQTINADGIQDSAVRDDFAVGGELQSWFLEQMMTPEHSNRATDLDDLRFRFQRWRTYIEGITDGPLVRKYLASQAGQNPGPDDKKKLLAAVEADKKQMADEHAINVEFGGLLSGEEWATKPVMRSIQAGRRLILRIDRTTTNPIRRAVAMKKVKTAVLNRLKEQLSGLIEQLQFADARRYAMTMLRVEPMPPRRGVMYHKRETDDSRSVDSYLAALAH